MIYGEKVRNVTKKWLEIRTKSIFVLISRENFLNRFEEIELDFIENLVYFELNSIVKLSEKIVYWCLRSIFLGKSRIEI